MSSAELVSKVVGLVDETLDTGIPSSTMASARQLRVAFVDYVLEPSKPGRSGLSDVVWDMASALVNLGHQAHVIASYHTDQYPDARVIVHNFATPPMGYRNILGQVWLLKRAAKIVRLLDPDIVHAPEYVSTAVFAMLGVPAPLVLTVPGNIFLRIRQGNAYSWHFTQVLKWAARVSAHRAAAVIAISNEMKRWWEWTGSAPTRTLSIPLGVDPERFHPMTGAREHVRWATGKLHLLYVGRFSKEKGISDLLEALHRLRPEAHAARLHLTLIGSGPEQKKIEQQIAEFALNDMVTVQGWVASEELAWWYSAADALVMPSWNEPLGRVMLEAMSCGTPVIASSTEGPRDHIRDGENGMLFAAHDVAELTSCLARVVANSQILDPLGAQALLYAREHLHWDKIVSHIVEQVYGPNLR